LGLSGSEYQPEMIYALEHTHVVRRPDAIFVFEAKSAARKRGTSGLWEQYWTQAFEGDDRTFSSHSPFCFSVLPVGPWHEKRGALRT